MLGGVQGARSLLQRHSGGLEDLRRCGPPDGGGAQGPRGQVQLRRAEHLQVRDALALVAEHLAGHVHVPEAPRHRAPRQLLTDLADLRRGDPAGPRAVVHVAARHQGDAVVQGQLVDDEGRTLVHVDRALVHRGVGGRGVHRAQQSASAGLDHAYGVTTGAAQVGQPARRLGVRPVPPGGSAAQGAPLHQLVQQRRRGRSEHRELVRAQRHLGRRGAQVRREHVGVARVEDGGFDRCIQHRLRMVHQIGVERVLAGDEGDEPVGAGPAGAAGLLPQRHAGAGPAGDQHGVEAGDVHAQLQGVGRGEPPQLARADRPLQRAPLLGEVAAAVRRDPSGQLRHAALQVGARRGGHRLGPSA